MSFQHLKLIEPLLKALNDEGYTTPTPIQQQAIPIILERKDLLGCAQTGTGKTAAFALPMLQLLCEDAANPAENNHRGGPRPIKALILTPTRELAIQIDESFEAYGRHTGLKHLVIFGGVPQQAQVQALQRGTDILVATPGRLLDLCDQKLLDLRNIRYFVLDEADRMLDMGFINDVRKVLTKLPQKKHSLFFSATMPPEIQKLAASILVNPSKVEVTPVSSTAETIQQSVYFVEKKDKRSLLLHILKDSTIPTALVFTRTKHGADKVAQGLTRAGIRAEAIHGNKSQNARQRALVNFKNRHTRILVATDIAARGIDIDDLTHVINFELPNVPETYVHRIGRTGRAGASGTALSFCDGEEKEFLRDIQKLISRQIPVVEDHPHVLYGGLPVDAAPVVASADPGHSGHGHSGRNHGRSNNQQGGQQRKGQQQGGGRRNPGNGNQGGRGSNQQGIQRGGQNGNGNQGGGQRHNQSGGRPPKREQPAQQLEPMPGERISNGAETLSDSVQQDVQPGSQPDNGQQNMQRGRQNNNGNQGGQHNRNNRQGFQRGSQNNGGQNNGGQQGDPGNGQPDGKRSAEQKKPPRKNAGELKMPEQGKDYKDPLDGIDQKINRIEGDERW